MNSVRLSRTVAVGLGLILLASQPTFAAQCLAPDDGRPKISLVLGGGGARGTAHIGVIRALEELRVPVDYIAGTSMGALVGGMMATGMTADEMEAVITHIDWPNMFKDNVARKEEPFRRKRDDDLGLYGAKIGLSEGGTTLPRGAVAGQKIDFLLESVVSRRTRANNFDELPIPYRAVAVDILSAEAVVLGEGQLSTAMRSSMSLPAIFNPVEMGDRLLVDGGVLMNVPVSVGKEMGGDIVIAVNVGSPLAPKEKVKNMLQILGQLTGVVTVVNTREQLALLDENDLLVVPPLGDNITTGSFDKGVEAIPIGYDETMKQRDKFAALSISEAAWQERRSRLDLCSDDAPVIDYVRLENESRFTDDVIQTRIHVATGAPVDLDDLQHDVQRIYSLGFLESVSYRIEEESGRTGLVIHVEDDSRGTDFLEYGFGLRTADGESDFSLRLGYLKTDVGSKGGEFRGMVQLGEFLGGQAELYLPFGKELDWILAPAVTFEESRVKSFDSAGNQLAEYDLTNKVADLSGGYEFGTHSAIFAGARWGSGRADVRVGDPSLEPFDYDIGEYRVRYTFDTLDDRYFPKSGYLANIGINHSDQSLGADQEFEQAQLSVFGAWTVNRHSFFAGVEYDISSDDEIPIYALYSAGGFPRLSGYQYGELVGENLGLIMTGYRYQMLENSFFPGYVGATLEYGNVSRDQADVFDDGLVNGSVYVGFDSIIGPFYVGVGVAPGGRYSGFMTIGSIFINNSLIK